jgi:hypothetical protein
MPVSEKNVHVTIGFSRRGRTTIKVVRFLVEQNMLLRSSAAMTTLTVGCENQNRLVWIGWLPVALTFFCRGAREVGM